MVAENLLTQFIPSRARRARRWALWGVDAEALEIDIDIPEGGAVAMAFARLQFEDLSPDVKAAIKAALLRYCELDTLAMVMIVEAWREWSR